MDRIIKFIVMKLSNILVETFESQKMGKKLAIAPIFMILKSINFY